jgi:DNA-binding NarL/FixJ family response regulator
VAGGTLIVSRATGLFPDLVRWAGNLGFPDVVATAEERDILNTVINDLKPRIVLVESSFYQAATPLRMGQLLKTFPKLNTAAVSLNEYPVSLAAWFIWYGVKSYVSLWEGYTEFIKGLGKVREGKSYISPQVQRMLDLFPEWPKTNIKASKRLMEILVLLCNGFMAESIGEELDIKRNSVYRHLNRLYNTFNVDCRDEMVSLAWQLGLVSEKDMRFLDRRKKIDALPEWAEVNLKMNRRMNEHDYQD